MWSVEGWRFGVWTGFCGSLLVLFANIAIAGAASRDGGYIDGIGILAVGTSDYTSRLSTTYHVLINILSTILLSASNYCMQVLNSPTRRTIDTAHAKAQRVDMGIWSTRNFKYMRLTHKLAWLALGASSMPLHLL